LHEERQEGDTIGVREQYRKMINNCIKGKYLSNHAFKTLDKEILETDSISKPMVITIAAPWCPPCWPEIGALNALVDKYEDQVEFIVLFWDTKGNLKKMAPKYDKRIKRVAAKKTYAQNEEAPVYGNAFKHNLGLPASYVINKEKRIVNFSMGGIYAGKDATEEEVLKKNLDHLECVIQPILN
jgi:thiol-disulfide isomerase/thioredoxin